MPALITVATRREAEKLLARSNVLVTGTSDCAAMLKEAITEERPAAVVIAGYSGALDPSLPAGAIIVSRMASRSGSPDLVPDAGLLEVIRGEFHRRKTAFVYSRLLTCAEPVSDRRTKLALWNEFGAAAVDMETYPLAEAATAAGVPWVGVRVVVDGASRALPPSLRDWREDGDERQALKQALRRPREWPAYARLGLAYRAANRALPGAVAIVLAATNQPWEPDLSLPVI